MALVDALGDVVTLSKTEKRGLLLWASTAINLIGVLPLPPTMAAARVTLRPTLHLVRQEMRSTTKLMLSASVIEILVGHLNASIVGSLDDFVEQARAKLSQILADAGKLGEDMLNEIAKGLEAAVNGTLDAGGDLEAASAQISAADVSCCMTPKRPSATSSAACSAPIKPLAKAWPTAPRSTCCPTTSNVPSPPTQLNCGRWGQSCARN